ncbi:MAG: thiamine pyrophosphate-dependent enzyme [Pseudomonadota bacterium]
MKQKKVNGLYVPEPDFRPGDQPNFEAIEFPAAGTARRPEIDEQSKDCADLSDMLISVLDKDHQAVGPWADEIDDEVLRTGLRDMLKVRSYDARMTIAQRQGKTSFYMQATGEEAISCAFQRALRKDDMNFPTYRQQGSLIAAGCPLSRMMNQVYSNADDPLKGRQMPVFYSEKEYGYFSVSGNLGSQFVQAVGWAMGQAIDKSDNISVGWIGDGATAENDFHSALVFASTYRPPVVLNIVNNQWAISSYQGIARGAGETFAARALGFGLPGLRVDGNDYLAVLAAATWASKRARDGYGPTLIEFLTYRVGAHSTSDDPSAYRPKEESQAWPLGDPIERLKMYLIKKGAWSEERHTQAVAEIEINVIEAQKQAEAVGTLTSGAKPSARAMFDDVFRDYTPNLSRQRQELGV